MTLSSVQQLIKRETRGLVVDVGGGEAGAMATRGGQQKLSSDGNVNEPLFMPADVLHDLESVTRGQPSHPRLTRLQARLQGFTLVPLPEAKPDGRSLAEHLAVTSKETSDVITGLAQALADGLDARERKQLRAEIWQGVQALVDLDEALKQAEGDTS